jgi:hypothetical protein
MTRSERRTSRARATQVGATLLALVALGCGRTGADDVDAGRPAAAGSGGTGGGGAGTGGTGGSAAGGAAGSGTDPFAAARQACVDKINALRATEGKPAYLRWTEAEVCSDAEAKSDSVSKKAHGAFGMCKESAQDECPGWPNDANKIVTGCLQDMWEEGPGTDFNQHGHYINMSSTKYKYVACGFFATADKKMWAVQNFK